MSVSKQEVLMERIETHLRKTARQLIKVNTEEEALQYLTDSFRLELYCDFVGVIIKEDDLFIPKAWSGHIPSVANAFSLHVEECSPKLMLYSLTDESQNAGCRFAEILKQNDVKTWFSVPLKDDYHHYGFCVLGFLNYVPLLDMEKTFEDFGQDIALAISITRQKEAQLKKVEGIEWISQNFSLGTPIEQHIYELTTRAGTATNADIACIYLFNGSLDCLELQNPYFGEFEPEVKIMMNNYVLKDHFPFLETIGGRQLTVPIVMGVKPMGVLHIEKIKGEVFQDEDLRMLELLSKYFSSILENASLFNNEKDYKKRLHSLIEYQQALVKETVDDHNFDGITTLLNRLFQNSVILFDRFLLPISYELKGADQDPNLMSVLIKGAQKAVVSIKNHETLTIQTNNDPEDYFSFWPVAGGNSLLGYLAIRLSNEKMDEYDQLAIELARNICSIQFIKQKLVVDGMEQAKGSFIGKLLAEKIEDTGQIIQYANLFHWDLYRSHRVSTISIKLHQKVVETSNLLEQQAKKTSIWEFIKSVLLDIDHKIITASHDDHFILIVPAEAEGEQPRVFWETLYNKMKEGSEVKVSKCQILLGIGERTTTIQDYHVSYQQSIQALNVVNSRFWEDGFSMFEDLGSYTIFSQFKEVKAIQLFLKKYMEPLLKYSEDKNIDLCHTLYVFLQNNGNVKITAEDLFIHRSSLLYRLEKIESLIAEDLNNAEVRLNLMMAFKFFDLYGDGMTKN
ncbi:helix-turn-helix domain-containing protein [Niallia endozanthoxylica]|uniref:PucR family transcriptional regulator n=1 Tax=Niallia endozanthoxylica TaxID=2036016 RepID=A0A5J5I1T9_9BACI|nr:helix-turn-helix domain-containing protein [Niallia endozanthoxylica]KAA9028509.1 PucR family transcriptional regulator [Niallia endozanthoxylica]